jgi:hypothetical protein
MKIFAEQGYYIIRSVMSTVCWTIWDFIPLKGKKFPRAKLQALILELCIRGASSRVTILGWGGNRRFWGFFGLVGAKILIFVSIVRKFC